MTNISHQILEGKTIAEILQLEEQAEKLPEGFKFKYKTPKKNFAEKLVEEIK